MIRADLFLQMGFQPSDTVDQGIDHLSCFMAKANFFIIEFLINN